MALNMNILEKYNLDLETIIKKFPWKNWGTHFSSSQIVSTSKWNQLQVVCPFHSDKSPSMGISKERNAYNCFVCSNRVWESKVIEKEKSIWRGTFIQLIKVFYEQVLWREISNVEIAELCEIREDEKRFFLSDLKQLKNTAREWQLQQVRVYEEEKEEHYKYSFLREVDAKKTGYLRGRLLKYNDISEEQYNDTVNHFLLKTLEDESIVIPIIKDWFLTGVYVRRNGEWTWKYYNLKSFKKTNVIYNWDFVNEYDDILLVEGPLNAIRLWALWFKNVVSLFSALPYKGQVDLLNTKKNIYVWFDQDEAGVNGIKKLSDELDKKVNLYSLAVEWKKDVYDYSKDEVINLFKQFKKIN